MTARTSPAMRPFSQTILNRLVIAAVIVGFLAVMAAASAAVATLRRNLEFTDLVTHTYQVVDAISEYRVANERLETARRGYLLTRDESFLVIYATTTEEIGPDMERIATLTVDNPRQVANVARLRALAAAQRAAIETSMREALALPQDAARRFTTDPAVQFTRQIRALAQAMTAEERRLLTAREGERMSALKGLMGNAISGGVLLLLVGLGSVWVIIRFTQDLTASREELRKLNEGLEDEVRARTSDLQRANDEIQRFAYIVSHDLRSPLVNVMGFTSELESAAKALNALIVRAEAEAPHLVTPDARAAVHEDLPEAIGFIRTSTQKMDRLINAILKLSREGRRVLTPERLDTEVLMTGIAAALQHRREELGAEIEVASGLPSIVSDRLAAEQVFSNLVENALKYLKPGRPGRIVIRGRTQGGRAIFEIEDNGRGVDPKDHERIFELFRRSGTQDQPGEGIGLAHVRALAYRLGGTVSVDSVLDRGATFRVSLPLILSLEGAAA